MTPSRACAPVRHAVRGVGALPALALLLVTACRESAGPGKTEPLADPAAGVLVFSASEPTSPPSSEVYVVNADGSALARLTNTPDTEIEPRWTADGTRIRFSSFRVGVTGSEGRYEMNADGSDVRLLPAQPSNGRMNATLSPDGQKLAYSWYSGSGSVTTYAVFVANADGSAAVPVAEFPCSLGCQIVDYLRWSPDGRRLAFTAGIAGSGGSRYGELYVVNADGTGRMTLTPSLALEQYPEWSPDGQRIAFTVTCGCAVGLNGDIYVMNADGSGSPTRLTRQPADGPELNSRPMWSPDGRWLAYLRNGPRTGRVAAIYLIHPDGTGARPVVALPERSVFTVDWNPVLTSR